MDLANVTTYYLEPGYIYFSVTPAVVRTVVGSCVAVCIWDRALQYGGVNHFLHPVIREAERATPQYGNVAMAALVRIMEEAGCERRNLVAQITGGACPEHLHARSTAPGTDFVGEANVRIAREMLARKGIPIISEDVGGTMGRKIAFDTSTGQLAVLKVHRLRETDWVY